VLFHFELRCNGRWEAFGSGEADGDDPVAALADLIGLAGGSLPAGTYRCIAARSESARWDSLALGADGTITAADAYAARTGEIGPARVGRAARADPTRPVAEESDAASSSLHG
jgi:hypothetical protein